MRSAVEPEPRSKAVAVWKKLRAAALDKDIDRSTAIKTGLKNILGDEFPIEKPFRRLEEAIRRYGAATTHARDATPMAPLFGEEAGLLDGPNRTWGPAKELLEAYQEATEVLGGLFKKGDNRAPRIAAGPVREFLSLGLSVDGALRIFGYHPLRLAQQLEVEKRALGELEAVLREPGPWREIPLVAMPELEGFPALLPDPRGEAPADAPFLGPGPSSRGQDPWFQDYVPLRPEEPGDADLVECLRPFLDDLAHRLLPGASRRMSVELSRGSARGSGIRLLLALADAVTRTRGGGEGTRGIDLFATGPFPASEAEVSAAIEHEHIDRDDLNTDRLVDSLRSPQPDDPRFALEVHPAPAAPDEPPREHVQPRHHVTLLLRPSEGAACRIGGNDWRTQCRAGQEPGRGATPTVGLAWDQDSRAWARYQLAGGPGLARELAFHDLVVRFWRGEADAMSRVLCRTVEGDPETGGKALWAAVKAALRVSHRVLVVDPIFGAEAVDATRLQGIEVVLADRHRKTGLRLTLLAPSAEREVILLTQGLKNALGAAFDGAHQDLARVVYRSTNRTVPHATRALWRAAAGSPLEGEIVGHLGVALLASPDREPLSGIEVPDGWEWLRDKPKEGSILLSMDDLQSWTWTRTGGRRGDFIWLLPEPRGFEGKALLVAVESKGSEGKTYYDGRAQAAIARRKLEERFTGDQRVLEREGLLAVLGHEAFRATGDTAPLRRLIAESKIEFRALCVSTAWQGDDPLSSLGEDLPEAGESPAKELWVGARGLRGLQGLAGLPGGAHGNP